MIRNHLRKPKQENKSLEGMERTILKIKEGKGRNTDNHDQTKQRMSGQGISTRATSRKKHKTAQANRIGSDKLHE